MIPNYKRSCHKIPLEFHKTDYRLVTRTFPYKPNNSVVCPFCGGIITYGENYGSARIECKTCRYILHFEEQARSGKIVLTNIDYRDFRVGSNYGIINYRRKPSFYSTNIGSIEGIFDLQKLINTLNVASMQPQKQPEAKTTINIPTFEVAEQAVARVRFTREQIVHGFAQVQPANIAINVAVEAQ